MSTPTPSQGISMAERLRSFMNHPAGPRTIFFWAPAMKWALVFASISDLRKHPDQVSTNQTIALGATGIIWARYATQITPKNWSLFTVNLFVAGTNLYQLYRKWQYSRGNLQLNLKQLEQPSAAAAAVATAAPSSSTSVVTTSPKQQ